MQADPPRISIVVPVFERADAVGPTLASALAQHGASFEVIAVDDGSRDGLAEHLAERWPAVRCLRLERNRGPAAALNAGVAAARGELVGFLDSDDLWSADKLRLQVADFDAHPEASLSFTDIAYGRRGVGRLYSDEHPLEPARLLEQLAEEAPTLLSAVLVRRRDYEAIGGAAEELRHVYDRDLLLRFAALGPFRCLPLPLVRRVVRPDAFSRVSERWDVEYPQLVERLLARPEGAALRARADRLYAYQDLRIGLRRARAEGWRPALPYLRRALARDLLVALRRPGGLRLTRAFLGRGAPGTLGRLVAGRPGARARRARSAEMLAASFAAPPPAP